jgi:hypothetical protein
MGAEGGGGVGLRWRGRGERRRPGERRGSREDGASWMTGGGGEGKLETTCNVLAVGKEEIGILYLGFYGVPSYTGCYSCRPN